MQLNKNPLGGDLPIMFDSGSGLNFNIPGMGGKNPTGGAGLDGITTFTAQPSPAYNGDSIVHPTTGLDIGNVLQTGGTLPVNPDGQQNPNPNSTINPNAGNSGVPGLTTGPGGFLGNTDITKLTAQLDEIFGKGMGGAIVNSITNQYNPEIAKSLIAAMQPALTQGRNNIREAFGASGGSGGSPLALGLSNFESQATLGENEIVANLFQQAQNNSTGIIQSLLRPAESFEANKSTAFDKISNVMKLLSSLGLTGGAAGGSIGKLIQDALKKITGQKGNSPAGGTQQGPSTGGNQGQGGYTSFPLTNNSLIGNNSGDTFQQWLDQLANGDLDTSVPFAGDTGITGATPWMGSDPNDIMSGIFGNDVTPIPTQGDNSSDPFGGAFDPFGSGGIDPSNGFDPYAASTAQANQYYYDDNGYNPGEQGIDTLFSYGGTTVEQGSGDFWNG